MKPYPKIRLAYGRIPSANCKGLCYEACGPILLSKTEADKMRRARGSEEPLSDGASCPHLADRRCSVYSHRPMICRLYGVAEGLLCAHGCEPDYVLSEREARIALADVERADSRTVLLTHEGRMS